MPWLADIITVLEGASVGTFNADLFASTMADVPLLASGVPTVAVVETGGTAPDNTQNATVTPAYLQPGAQVMVRGGDYVATMAKARAAYNALFAVRNQFINSGWYVSIRPTQEPFDLGVDDRGQARVAFNVLGKKRP